MANVINITAPAVAKAVPFSATDPKWRFKLLASVLEMDDETKLLFADRTEAMGYADLADSVRQLASLDWTEAEINLIRGAA